MHETHFSRILRFDTLESGESAGNRPTLRVVQQVSG
jgi:hypothetical protein